MRYAYALLLLVVGWVETCEGYCVDNPGWFLKKAGKDCAWVAKNTDTRCAKTAKIRAEDACLKTCGDGASDASWWFTKKVNKNCGWVRGGAERARARHLTRRVAGREEGVQEVQEEK